MVAFDTTKHMLIYMALNVNVSIVDFNAYASQWFVECYVRRENRFKPQVFHHILTHVLLVLLSGLICHQLISFQITWNSFQPKDISVQSSLLTSYDNQH